MIATDVVPRQHTGSAAEAVAPRQETVMGHAIPRQQPAVVLRSRFDHLRALLAVALAVVVGLTIAVVILAGDSDELSSTSAAKPIEPTPSALPAQLPNTRYEPSTDGPLPARLPNTRYEPSTDGPLPARLPNTRYEPSTDGPLPARLPSSSPAAEAKHEAATAAAIGHPGGGTVTGGSKTDPHSPASLLP
jgi:hypothetical protein